MKKLGLVSLAAVVIASVAFAGQIVIPFFDDNAGTTWVSGKPGSPNGTASFIGILNTTGSDIVCTISYRLGDATPADPVGVNTFTLPAYQALSFRPGRNDTVNESPAARTVPNMGSAYPYLAGNAVISWTGGSAGDVIGRVFSVNSSGEATAYGPILSK